MATADADLMPPGDGTRDPVRIFGAEDQRIIRAAWLYYIAGMTQAQVAKRLGMNRIRVNRLLAEARDAGIVQIRINARLADCVALEERLIQHFGCREVVVVPTPASTADIARTIAVAAGTAVSSRLRDGMAVGVSWGRTLRFSLQSMDMRPIKHLSIVSLLGGLTRGSVMNSYETASRMADLFGAECVYVAGPVFADTAESRDMLLRQASIKDAFDHARKVDLALISAGALSPDSTMVELGLIKPDDIASLKAAGAVGDICAHWINAEGELVDHPLNRRVLALEPSAMKKVPTAILAAGGLDKVLVLHGALKAGFCDILVTDEATAAALMDYAEGKTPAKPARPAKSR